MQTVMKYLLRLWLAATVLSILSLFSTGSAFAYQVDQLPPDNLVYNPWFRDPADPTRSSLAGWTDAAGENQYWSTSQKLSNPSPDEFVAGPCGGEPGYCGTSARLNTTPGKSGGTGGVGADAYLYQVIPADPENTRLKYFAHWVAHAIDPAEVTINGGETPEGPWVQVWRPFHAVLKYEAKPPPGEGQDWLWKANTASTPPVETTLSRGYPYYKLEIHARLVSQDTSAFKITGIYFTALPAAAHATLPPVLETVPAPASTSIPTATRVASGGTPAPTAAEQKPPLDLIEILLALIRQLLRLLY
jgi:hypothetical protein